MKFVAFNVAIQREKLDDFKNQTIDSTAVKANFYYPQFSYINS